MQITKKQEGVLSEVLEEWLSNELEVLADWANYMNRQEFIERKAQAINIALILEQGLQLNAETIKGYKDEISELD